MNESTKKVLDEISSKVPTELAENITKKVVDASGEDMARIAMESPDISKDKKEQLARLIEAGKFRSEETVVNEEVAARIDKYNEKAVQAAIKSGRIPDPKKDPFVRERLHRIASQDYRKADPLTRQEIIRATKALRKR